MYSREDGERGTTPIIGEKNTMRSGFGSVEPGVQRVEGVLDRERSAVGVAGEEEGLPGADLRGGRGARRDARPPASPPIAPSSVPGHRAVARHAEAQGVEAEPR